MSKIIAFSLYGDEPKYIRGLYENLKIKEEQQLYQDWKVVVFHDNTLTEETLSRLKNHDVELIDMTESGILAASWRFCVADLECERFIIRDSDSRFSKREEEAVQKREFVCFAARQLVPHILPKAAARRSLMRHAKRPTTSELTQRAN